MHTHTAILTPTLAQLMDGAWPFALSLVLLNDNREAVGTAPGMIALDLSFHTRHVLQPH